MSLAIDDGLTDQRSGTAAEAVNRAGKR